MSQLILTVMAIALTAATVVSSLNYIPWWYKTAADTDIVLRSSLPTLEKAYKAAARNNGGLAPAVTGDADGGFVANFQPILQLLPAAPRGYAWSYNQHPADSSQWDSLHYFCLSKAEPASIGDWRGFSRTQPLYSTAQFVMGSSCGQTTPSAEPASLPSSLALTFFVTFVPGVDDV